MKKADYLANASSSLFAAIILFSREALDSIVKQNNITIPFYKPASIVIVAIAIPFAYSILAQPLFDSLLRIRLIRRWLYSSRMSLEGVWHEQLDDGTISLIEVGYEPGDGEYTLNGVNYDRQGSVIRFFRGKTLDAKIDGSNLVYRYEAFDRSSRRSKFDGMGEIRLSPHGRSDSQVFGFFWIEKTTNRSTPTDAEIAFTWKRLTSSELAIFKRNPAIIAKEILGIRDSHK
jgi:hypothetical protein